jgi:methylated-DNA-[protein]-cysteine S-methyltransferase
MWTLIDTPAGQMRIVAHDGAVTAAEFVTEPAEDATVRSSSRVAAARSAARDDGRRADDNPVLREAARQLTAYFAGKLTDFDLPLAPGGTPFQERVWAELRQIGYGRTASYGEIAARLGMSPGASRAVGAANGRNPIGVVIPCHRVIGSKGLLSGYAGGVERKRLLLDLEQKALF